MYISGVSIWCIYLVYISGVSIWCVYRVSHNKVYLLNRPILQPPNIAQLLFSTRNLCPGPFKRTTYKYSSLFTFRDMKCSIEYLHFQGFYTLNFDGPEKLKYFKLSWIWSLIILFGVYMFLKMGNIIYFCFCHTWAPS